MTGPGWLWGLLPLAALWAAGSLLLDEPIRRDLELRTADAMAPVLGPANGGRAPVSTIDGRDVTIVGEAPTADAATRGMETVRGTFGVRRAFGGLSQVVVRKPYDWMASRTADGVRLSGAVPDEETARMLVGLAERTFPGSRIDDRQELAHGAPEGFAAQAQALVELLPRLAEGRVAIDDTRICIEGTAADAAALALLRDRARLAAGAFTVVGCAVLAPKVSPYRWRAVKTADPSIRIEGHHPDEATQREIVRLLRTAFPEPVSIVDGSRPASGAPAGFTASVARAVGDLARLRNGSVEIVDAVYRIRGVGPADPVACAALRQAVAGPAPAGSAVEAEIECPAPPQPRPVEQAPKPSPTPSPAPPPAAVAPPPVAAAPQSLTMELDGRTLTLTGVAPDAGGLAALDELARSLRPELAVERRFLSAGAPPVPERAFRAALFDLLRLDLGSAEVSRSGASLSGITCRRLIRDEVRNGTLARLGSRADVRVSLRQTGCTLGEAAICQNRLDELSRRHPVLFGQGVGAPSLDAATERFVEEAVTILDGCPGSGVVIEGHANNDGAERGFDNRDLSERRARRLRDELAARGVAAERLSIRAFGADRPLVAEDAPEAKTLNRRLQLTVTR